MQVEVFDATTLEWVNVATGTSVGNKKIDLFPGPVVNALAVRLSVTSAVDTPMLRNFAAFLCERF